jgi:hypothetical protein
MDNNKRFGAKDNFNPVSKAEKDKIPTKFNVWLSNTVLLGAKVYEHFDEVDEICHSVIGNTAITTNQ